MKTNFKLEQNAQSELVCNALGILLLFAASQLYIPIRPVPITMQSVGIIAISLLYNFQNASIIYFSYIGLGLLGVPVFASYGSGPVIFFGSSFGYFIGFFAAIYIINKIKIKFGYSSFNQLLVNCLAGTIIMVIFGVAWLSILFGIEKAIMVGLIPFIIPGIAKALLLSIIVRLINISS